MNSKDSYIEDLLDYFSVCTLELPTAHHVDVKNTTQVPLPTALHVDVKNVTQVPLPTALHVDVKNMTQVPLTNPSPLNTQTLQIPSC